MSKRKTEGFQNKLEWLKARFAEGMRIKMLELPERGFIEYLPGEYAWRSVNAPDYMFIHCLWIVGKSKNQGFAGALMQECFRDAKAAGKIGVAMLASEGNWLMGKKALVKHGFVSAAKESPFTLMVKRFGQADPPSFTGGWEEKAGRFGAGLTVIRTAQCPYIPDATDTVLEVARELGISSRVVELKSSEEIREKAPSPYGVFNIVYDGRLLSYHYLLPKDMKAALIKAASR
ncbi:MAG: GNAT family N-acetyltransferase, partial [Candidatus Aminicenantaceae bacterium]